MERLWSLVLETSIYASVVGIVILLAKTILKDKINGKWSYLLWMLLIIKLIIPFGPESYISIFNKIPVNISKSMSEDKNTIINSDKENIGSYTSGYESYENIGNEVSENTTRNPIVNKGVQSTKKTNINYIYEFSNILSLLWIAGFITSICVAFFMNFALSRQFKIRENIQNEKLGLLLEKCKNQMNVKSNIEVIINDSIRTPALCKVIKPKILFPKSMIDLKEEEIEYILLHELSHYKRCDILVNYLLIFLQCIHWFNPFIWYLFKRIKEDMELATDEMVISKLNEENHKNYARTIITIIERVSIIPKNIGVLGMADDKKILKKRIEMIKKAKVFKNKKYLISSIGVICLLILGSLLLTSRINSEKKVVEGRYESLLSYKSPYIGDANNVGILLQNLNFGSSKSGMELQTSKEPYGLKVYYNFNYKKASEEDMKTKFFINSVIIFSLIENVDNVEYHILDGKYTENPKSMQVFKFNRDEVEYELGIDNISEYSGSKEQFDLLLSKISRYRSVSNTLDEAINGAVKNSMFYDFIDGELDSEAHVILGKKENGNIVEVYTVVNYGTFEFENEVFTLATGAYCKPLVMIFEKDKDNNYYFIDYKEIVDGSYYYRSVIESYPLYLWANVLSSDKYFKNLSMQHENQAKEYLKSINREAKINVDENNTEVSQKEYPNINYTAYDKLENIEELYKYPSWLGSREKIIDGHRYKYETSLIVGSDGYKIMIYKKTDEKNNILEEHQYKIIGSDIKETKHEVK